VCLRLLTEVRGHRLVQEPGVPPETDHHHQIGCTRWWRDHRHVLARADGGELCRWRRHLKPRPSRRHCRVVCPHPVAAGTASLFKSTCVLCGERSRERSRMGWRHAQSVVVSCRRRRLGGQAVVWSGLVWSPRSRTAQAALLPLSEEVLMWCGEVCHVVWRGSDRVPGGMQAASGSGSKESDWHVSPLLPKRLEPLELRGAPRQVSDSARLLQVSDSPGFLEVPPLPVQVYPQFRLSLSLSRNVVIEDIGGGYGCGDAP
jgi:hypothetical protein